MVEEFLRRLLEALQHKGVQNAQVGVQTPPLAISATWIDPAAAKRKYTVCRVDSGFIENVPAHAMFIDDFSSRVAESIGALGNAVR